ncbi:helix-turn-helix transcriptional regulator [Paenibacillus sp. IB182496]|uniref:Helix-turn-helix transcriptional regulator n=1 Tax=Paenibacillus sabuli TaxID=2772509 RepID=A0A927BWY8_9BACL|nr:AraC family transcriptional regulator [Paenibacillus sabuli]MBD2847867.1 helix-turn-helix transcriptional regulator [Paenibacillus sabuli]
MQIYQEPIHPQDRELGIKVLAYTSAPRPAEAQPSAWRWHYHKEIEVVLVCEGVHEMHTVQRAYRLEAGDVAVFGSNQLHRTGPPGPDPMRCMVIHFELQPYLDAALWRYARHYAELLEPLDSVNYIFAEQPAARAEAAALVGRLYDEVTQSRPGYELAVSAAVHELLLLLLRADTRGVLAPAGAGDARVIRRTLTLIDSRLPGKVTLQEASDAAGMSYSYFSAYFKQATGSSFTDFVNRRRIQEAERLLVSADLTVAEAARAAGMENMAHFYALFKRYNGVTPGQYLRRLGK